MVLDQNPLSQRTIAKIVFVARPDDVSSILSRLSFGSFREGFNIITIRVFDGINGNCLGDVKHPSRKSNRNGSSHRDCFRCDRVDSGLGLREQTKRAQKIARRVDLGTPRSPRCDNSVFVSSRKARENEFG